MKLRFLALCLLLCSLLTLTAFAQENDALLLDVADVLTEKEEAEVLAKLQKISVDVDVAVITLDESHEGDMEWLANEWYDQMGYRDGILLLWRRGTSYNEYYLLCDGRGMDIFDDDVLDALEGDCVDHLRDKNFEEAFLTFADVCEEAIADYGRISIMPIIFCIAIGAILSFVIPMASLKGELKSVRSKPAAQSYVRAGSFCLTTQRDIFLYHRVIATPKPKNNSSGGRPRGGGGRAGRGGRC